MQSNFGVLMRTAHSRCRRFRLLDVRPPEAQLVLDAVEGAGAKKARLRVGDGRRRRKPIAQREEEEESGREQRGFVENASYRLSPRLKKGQER